MTDLILATKPLGFVWETPDPFLFCVHHEDAYPAGNEQMGPAASLTARRLGNDFEARDGWRMYHGKDVPGFPHHPHRGFETVTVVRRGVIDHSDSLGAAGRYGDGDVQWLTAGSGVQHAEMFPLRDRAAPNPLELFQIWLNLPAADKMAEPFFAMLWNEQIPRTTVQDEAGRATELTIIAGHHGDLRPPSPPPRSWATRPDADVAIWTLKMAPEARFTVPAASPGTNRTLYFYGGDTLSIAGRTVAASHGVDLRADAPAELVAGPTGAELLLLQGKPIGEPVAQHGPFVMNTMEEIQQAFADFRRTQFGGWPWPSDDPVHEREEGRFARHADGRIERPARG